MIIEQNSSSKQPLATHDVVRSDLNIEKWTIWHPKNSRQEQEDVLTFTRETTTPDGKRLSVKVEVHSVRKFGNLTTEDQRVFYALLAYWNEKGQPSTPVAFSLRKLLRLLKRDYGLKQRHSVIRSLLRLRVTPFIWTNSYYDSVTKTLHEEIDPFNILSELKIARTQRDKTVNREAGIFKFNDFILANLLNRYCKPVFLDTVLSFKSEIAQLLYTRLDLLLADKTHYERRSKELFFDDLGLRGEAYKNLSNRKQALTRALRELEGKPLTTGTITEAKLEKTEDGKDYKAVFKKNRHDAKKSKRREKRDAKTVDDLPESIATIEPSTETITPTATIEPSIATIEPKPSVTHEPSDARKLLTYFDEIFFGAVQDEPSSNILRKAQKFIDEHGLEKGKYLVDFAHMKAQESGYEPATFAGIVRFTGKALEALDEEQRIKRIREREAALVAERREKDKWDALLVKHRDDYNAYIEAEAHADSALMDRFEAKEKADIEAIKREIEEGSATQRKLKESLLRVHTKPDARCGRMLEFWKSHGTPICSFSQWYLETHRQGALERP